MKGNDFSTQSFGALRGRKVLSLPADNSLKFLAVVFDCWHEGRPFSITRSPEALSGFGLDIESMVLEEAGTGGWGHFVHCPRLSDDPAQIVFSSGTEGRPKAILLSHRNLADVVNRLNAVMGVTDEIREYIGVPVTYSFGLGRARAVAAAGGAFFIPERFDPSQIRDMLARGEINAISAVPSLWRLILANPDVIGVEGGRVRWIEIGSQHMSASDKKALRNLFPNARIVQHYGLTEASRTTFLDLEHASDEELESVGRATGTVTLGITPEGAIAIKGDHVALGQLSEGGMVTPMTDADGWLITRDKGEIRNGCLHYLGRLDDQINLAGIKIGAEALEAEIRAILPGAGDHFAIAAIADSARGEAVLLAIQAAAGDHAPLIEGAARLVLDRRGIRVGQGAGSVLKILSMEELPRTGTNKVQRGVLTEHWAAQDRAEPQAADPGDLSLDLTEDEARLALIWAKVVGSAEFTPRTSFYDAGGDSLSSVQIGLVMEHEDLPRPVIRATLEGRTLREAAMAMAGNDAPGLDGAELPDAARRSWAITMTRAIMAISVVISHWGPGLFGRIGLESHAERVLALIYRMGTPGFAAVFGIGIGYFMLPGFAEKRESALRRLSASFRLVMLGILLLAGIKMANLLLRGEPIGGLQIAHLFYGVLGYYALMLGTARWWLPLLARLHHPIPWLLAGLPILWLAWQIIPQFVPSQQLQSVLEWPRLMMVAGYNVFKMTAVAAAGMAAGLWLSKQKDSRDASRKLILSGGFGIILALMIIVEAYGADDFLRRGSPIFTSLPGLILYISTAVFGTGLFLLALMAWERMGRVSRLPLKLLIVIGGLALPIYIFHGLVIPGRDLMSGLGVPKILSLPLAIGGFLVVMGYAGRRLWRMYFD